MLFLLMWPSQSISQIMLQTVNKQNKEMWQMFNLIGMIHINKINWRLLHYTFN